MKKLVFCTIIMMLAASATHAQVKVYTDGKVKFTGNVGFATEPSSTYKIQISGDTRITGNPSVSSLIINDAGGYYGPSIYPSDNYSCDLGISGHQFKYVRCYDLQETSDLRQKENIREIKNPLDLVLGMHGVLFDLKIEYILNEDLLDNDEYIQQLEKDRKNYYGLVAQELIEVVPEVVDYDENADIYSVNYTRLVPILIEAVKEQNEKIIELENKIKDKEEKSSEEPLLFSGSGAILKQNQPNPFYENTFIEFYLPNEVEKAIFYVYDFQGKQIKAQNIIERENGNIIIHGSELQAGMYYYSIIADGKLIGTRQMVLTD